MNPLNELELFIEQHRIQNQSMKLITATDALEFVKLCKNKDVFLGGFDGFYVDGQKVRIDQKLSPNYSKYTKEAAIEQALAFFEKHKDDTENIGYEMVIASLKTSNNTAN